MLGSHSGVLREQTKEAPSWWSSSGHSAFKFSMMPFSYQLFGRRSSYIDVALATPIISQFIGEWKVRQKWTSSYHNSVDIRVRVPKATGNEREG